MLGFALGRVGMSRREFEDLRPEEFAEVSKAWNDGQEARSREEWERMRMEATLLIQPHVKGKLTPQRLLPFPWEASDFRPHTAESLTLEERKQRAEEALRKWG